MQEAASDTIAIIGAGNMGTAIASLFGAHGWLVLLIDPSEQACAKSRERLRGKPGKEAVAPAQFSWNSHLHAAAAASLIIEAVPEDAALKKEVFRQLEAHISPTALLATNTSGISINTLSEGMQHPERFIGTHFFTPADIIPLVEVIACEYTSAATSQQMIQTLRSVGKLPVLVRKDIPGFIANRLQHALAREAMSLLEKGIASAEDIDQVARWSLGIRLALTGPLEQRDINGLDVHHAIAEYLYPDLENRQRPLQILRDKVQQGHTGVKSGQGFYDWNSPARRNALERKEAALQDLTAYLRAYHSDTD